LIGIWGLDLTLDKSEEDTIKHAAILSGRSPAMKLSFRVSRNLGAFSAAQFWTMSLVITLSRSNQFEISNIQERKIKVV